jgi:transglutaminase-like putative cysteine protease
MPAPWFVRSMCSLLTVCNLIGGSVALAADAPSWMHAQVAAPLPAHDEKTTAVLLYSERVLTILPDKQIRRLTRKAFRILRPDGAGRGVVRVDLDGQTRLIGLRAWCIPTAGKDYAVNEKDALESSVIGVENGELMSDIRTRLLRIPATVPGSIVGYEVEEEQKPYVMADEWEFQDTVPVREARYTLQLPSGWAYKTTWLNHAEQSPTATGNNQWQWVVSDVAAARVEQNMPPWRGVTGRMIVALSPPDGQEPGIQSWRQMGEWYLNLTRGRRDASPEIKQKVVALTSSAPTLLAKVQALASFVQNDIRYVAIELGLGGYQPHPAAEVFAHRFGDCKDKVTLLSTMLKEIGVDSYYVIVNTERGSITATTPPNLAFNHAILAIALPGGLEDPTLLARESHPKLGRILFFDPTDSLTPFGRLAGPLQASYGMLVTADGGELVELPHLPAASNAVNRTAALTLDEQGTLRGDVHEVRLGDEAAAERYALRFATQETDQIKPVEAVAAAAFGTFLILKASTVNARLPEQPFEWKYTVEVEGYAKLAGNLLLVRPRVLGSKSSGLLETPEPRQYAIEFEGPESDTDVFEIALPPGYEVDELPPPVSVDDGFASYRSKSELVGRTLRYTRSFAIQDLSVPVSKAEELKQFYRIINDDERNSAVLRRVSP